MIGNALIMDITLHELMPAAIHRMKRGLLRRYGRWMPDAKVELEGYRLRAPRGHTLADNRRLFPMYDRFLPMLASCLDREGVIVDVGANIGDTAVSMLSRCSHDILCVEPSRRFLRYLERNVGGLPEGERRRIRISEALVGTGDFEGTFRQEMATAYLEPDGSGGNAFVALDRLLAGEEKVALIKTDTDGSDHDVLLSGREAIAKHRPALFFENQVEDERRVVGFDLLYDWLSGTGYRHVCIIDNFGCLISVEEGFDMLKALNRYMSRQRASRGMVTLPYADVLACTTEDAMLFESVTSLYEQAHMAKI